MHTETLELVPFNAVVWRIMFATQQQQACEPVNSPNGRFHHSEQVALYTSCSEEGAGVAIKRYVREDDSERVIVPLSINANAIYDIRPTQLSAQASIVWQDIVAGVEPSPTWQFSDKAREAGAQGMLYSSRSRPELSHLVLFTVANGIVRHAGEAKAWTISKK